MSMDTLATTRRALIKRSTDAGVRALIEPILADGKPVDAPLLFSELVDRCGIAAYGAAGPMSAPLATRSAFRLMKCDTLDLVLTLIREASPDSHKAILADKRVPNALKAARRFEAGRSAAASLKRAWLAANNAMEEFWRHDNTSFAFLVARMAIGCTYEMPEQCPRGEIIQVMTHITHGSLPDCRTDLAAICIRHLKNAETAVLRTPNTEALVAA